MQGRRTPVQERSHETVKRILSSASRLLAQVPLEEITTSRIASESGVSIGGLYRFFPDKQAIVDAIATEHLKAFEREVRNRLSGLSMVDGPGFLTTMIDTYVCFLELRPDFRAITFGRHISAGTRRRESHPDTGVLALIKQFLLLQHEAADSAFLDTKIRVATEAGERLIAFAYEQKTVEDRHNVIQELKELLTRYLF
jgi:AcrR family transcriptional regulator